MILYLAGPMTGIPDYNYPLFNITAARLRALGYTVHSPTDYGLSSADWLTCMRRGITDLMKCDAIALLPDWHKSRGASIEYGLALSLGMPFYPVKELLAEELKETC